MKNFLRISFLFFSAAAGADREEIWPAVVKTIKPKILTRRHIQ
jgi:hypothetical protein